MTAERRVDHNQIRTNQAFTIVLLALAFVLDAPLLAAFTAAVLLLSAAAPPLGLFSRLYRHLLLPADLVRPQAIADNPEPHRFAQLVGGVVVAAGSLALVAGLTVPGWGLIGLVIILASLNLFAGWCAGCTLYYWLHRLGVPGFDRAPVEMTR
ncbi:MAG: DUF4395 domain-containing protein [Anaerolineae bacterium]|nr:DUF4395 domain-containing protein [Anaerolineae bacterium]